MDESEQNDLEKETNDSLNTFNQNAKRRKKIKSFHKEKIRVVYFLLPLL